nr:helix-turn-helix domain-containing protein [Allomuricauda sp.]
MKPFTDFSKYTPVNKNLVEKDVEGLHGIASYAIENKTFLISMALIFVSSYFLFLNKRRFQYRLTSIIILTSTLLTSLGVLLTQSDYSSSIKLILYAFLLVLGPICYVFREGGVRNLFSVKSVVQFLPAMALAALFVLKDANDLIHFFTTLSHFVKIHLLLYAYLNYTQFVGFNSLMKKEEKKWSISILILFSYLSFSIALKHVFSTLHWSSGVYLTPLFVLPTVLFTAIYFLATAKLGSSGKASESNESTPSKYASSSMSKRKSSELKDSLIHALENDKLYLKKDLSPGDLAKKLGVPRHHISQIINQNFNAGYYEFIGRFRIEEAVRILNNGNHQIQMQDVIGMVGYNNKASFYKAFKKHVGVSPTKYLRQKKIEEDKGNRAFKYQRKLT